MPECKRMKTINRSVFWKEYKTALEAQAAGLEGRARVCARRAAGYLIQEYLEKQNNKPAKMNSIELIQFIQRTSNSSEMVSLLGHYSETVNIDHHLASDVDLVACLHTLARLLNIDLQQTE